MLTDVIQECINYQLIIKSIFYILKQLKYVKQ